jgi:hypothetical protein
MLRSGGLGMISLWFVGFYLLEHNCPTASHGNAAAALETKVAWLRKEPIGSCTVTRIRNEFLRDVSHFSERDVYV